MIPNSLMLSILKVVATPSFLGPSRKSEWYLWMVEAVEWYSPLVDGKPSSHRRSHM